jgi:hypothetical protein
MRRPEGYRQTAAETWFCLLVLCLPYYQSLLIAGVSGSIYFLLMTCLLMFVVQHSPKVYSAISSSLKALPLSWLPPVPEVGVLWVSVPSRAVAWEPALAPLFQRPPPIFS